MVKFCTSFAGVTVEDTPYVSVSQNMEAAFATVTPKIQNLSFLSHSLCPPPEENPGSAPGRVSFLTFFALLRRTSVRAWQAGRPIASGRTPLALYAMWPT